ncbi:DUF6064 family protein [Acuticoccus sp. MNP-M23]|uniref:DUF6064 family protein n=1 Tax=Acuticoccus sp. MNP-M23 TaxID=3072793 RepID=UPI002815E3E4|nr:DUF6064 family protein [Acuticoccus sp. MNP-M23]WMS41964.1 DUF6064 family protein [Acuticoccus sp. MNP-M23]
METWLTYSPQDFLLFSAETYWRLFALANQSVWPLAAVAPLLLLGLCLALLSGAGRSGVAAILALGAGWVVVAEIFLARYYAPINMIAAYARPVFWVEAVLLVMFGLRLSFVADGLRRVAGTIFVLLAAAYPALGVVAGRPLNAAEVVGIAPDPTAVATLGLLLLARPSWRVGLLAIVPAGWLLVSAATLLTMGSATGWLALGAAIVATTVMSASAVWPNGSKETPR